MPIHSCTPYSLQHYSTSACRYGFLTHYISSCNALRLTMSSGEEHRIPDLSGNHCDFVAFVLVQVFFLLFCLSKTTACFVTQKGTQNMHKATLETSSPLHMGSASTTMQADLARLVPGATQETSKAEPCMG